MKTRIVRIGNSRGLRIPEPLIEQSGLGDEVDLEVDGGRIIIRAVTERRLKWPEAFRSMAETGDDAMLDRDEGPGGGWDDEEWEWWRVDSTCTWSRWVRRLERMRSATCDRKGKPLQTW